VVSTDDDEIAALALAAGADVVRRPPELATGSASSEAALQHALDVLSRPGDSAVGTASRLPSAAITPDVVAFLQATSPFIDPGDLRAAIDQVAQGEADVVFSARESHAFQWRLDPQGLTPVGHELGHRPMRQERSPHFQETGAFYVMNGPGFRRSGNRFFGRLSVQPVNEATAIEIDTVDDFKICELLAPAIDPTLGITPDPAIDVDAIVTDFDGVHTDDRVLIDPDGAEHVYVNRRDGWGVARVRRDGLPFLILSTEQNPIVRVRAAKLGVEVIHGAADKGQALRQWLNAAELDPARVAYLGNDVNDLPALALVGWPCAVADAHPDVIAAARVVLSRRGGDAAVRELCDRVLLARASG
jgi:N-acylneuraminate cytidylyltransferase